MSVNTYDSSKPNGLNMVSGRNADGVTVDSVKSLSQIKSDTLKPTDVASAEAVKQTMLEWVDISADFLAHITSFNKGSISTLNARRLGNFVTLFIEGSDVNAASAKDVVMDFAFDKYTPKDSRAFGVGQNGTSFYSIYLQDNGHGGIKIVNEAYSANATIRGYVTYYTENI